MRIQGALLKWFWRQTLPVTLGALPLACLYVIFARGPLKWNSAWPALFIWLHVDLLVFSIRRFSGTGCAFLYDRGYSRDLLWLHLILASALAVLVVWLPAAVIVWTPIRATIQEDLFRSPFFPVMAPVEWIVPWAWLLAYGVLIPVGHYVWIRMAQPTRGRYGGVLLGAGLVFTAFFILILNYRVDWFGWLVICGAVVVALAALFAGFLLNRRLEVKA